MIILFRFFVLKRLSGEEIGIASRRYCYTFRFKLGGFLEFTPMTCRRAAGARDRLQSRGYKFVSIYPTKLFVRSY